MTDENSMEARFFEGEFLAEIVCPWENAVKRRLLGLKNFVISQTRAIENSKGAIHSRSIEPSNGRKKKGYRL
jgi:hypothetical protein